MPSFLSRAWGEYGALRVSDISHPRDRSATRRKFQRWIRDEFGDRAQIDKAARELRLANLPQDRDQPHAATGKSELTMINRLLQGALLILVASGSYAQTLPTVFTCASVAADTPLNPWPSCANASYQPAGPGLIVAVTRAGAVLWEPSSAVLLSDNVFTSAPYNGTTSNWWPAKSFAWSSPVITGTVTLTWLAPTTNEDGSTPVNPVASYEIYSGPTAATLSAYASVPTPGLTYTTPALASGTYYFAISAIGTNGAESPKSSVISSTVPVPPLKQVAPGTPGNFTATFNP